LSAVLALAWIGVNADPGRSARRFEAVLEYDLTRAPYAYEVLGQYYRNSGDLDRGIEVLEKGMSLSYNPRLMALAAGLYDESGDTGEALRLLREVLERQPEIEGTRRNLVLLLHRLHMWDELYQVSREGTRYHPDKPVYHYFYGLALLNAGEVESGIDELLTCKRLGPGPDVIATVDRALRRLEAMGYDVGTRDSSTQFSIPQQRR
jgi:tetratricopeptide (TPR) repeat protein